MSLFNFVKVLYLQTRSATLQLIGERWVCMRIFNVGAAPKISDAVTQTGNPVIFFDAPPKVLITVHQNKRLILINLLT